MGEFASRIEIDRPAAEVFAFVADIRNMPAYLPTVRGADAQGEGRVVVEGEANGIPYRSDGWFRADASARRMEWGSDGENDYRGELLVEEAGGGQRARIELRLHLTPRPELERRLTAQTGSADSSVQEGIDAALASIKAHCEGTGGKHRTTAEHAQPGQAPDDAPKGAVEPRSGGREGKPDDDRMLRDSRGFGRSGTMNPDTV